MTRVIDIREFRRGWPVLLAGFVGIALGMVPVAGSYSIGVLTVPLEAEFGWRRGDIMLAPVFLYLGLIPSSFLVGWVADNFGVRLMTMFSLVALSAGFGVLGSSLASTLAVFLGIYFCIGLFGEAAGPISYTRVVVGWFQDNRGLALGMIMAGAGIAGTFVPLYTGWWVENHGWRDAYLGLAALPILITLPIVFFFLKEVPTLAIRRTDGRPRTMKGVPFRKAIKGYRFWVLAVAFSGITAAVLAAIANLVPMLTDGGYSIGQATGMASVLGVSVLLGRLSVGYLVDRFWAPKIGLFVMLPASSAFIFLANPDVGTAALVIGIAMIGFVTGAETDLMIYMLTRYFGQRSYGLLFALLYVCYNSFAAVGPPIFGYVHDALGHYDPALITASVVMVASALILLTLGKYPARWNTPAAENPVNGAKPSSEAGPR